MAERSLLSIVDELLSLNDDNLSVRVIQDNDVQWCLSELRDMLAADTEPVVRCRECVHYRDTEDWNRVKYKACHLLAHVCICKKGPDDFCSCGERKERVDEGL